MSTGVIESIRAHPRPVRLLLLLAIFPLSWMDSAAQDREPVPLAGTFCLSANTVSFSKCVLDPGLVPSQPVIIKNCGATTLSWFTAITYNQPQNNWLSVNPSNGALASNDSVAVSVIVTAVPQPGTYTATINLSSPNATNSPQRIGITYVVYSAPRMQIAPRQLVFQAERYSSQLPQPQTFRVTDSSRCNLQWNALPDSSWIVFAMAGRGEYTDYVNVWPNTTDLITGTHRTVIRLTSSNASNRTDSVVVLYTITDAIPIAPDSLRVEKVSDTELDLIWRDRSLNEDGFIVERKLLSADSVWNASAKWDTAGFTFQNISFFRDRKLAPCSTYVYRVRAFNSSGTSAYSNIDSGTTCRERGLLTEQSIFAYPNPIRAGQTTTIQFPLTQSSAVTIKIVDAANTVHRTIHVPADQAQACTKVQWDGRADDGSEVPNGVYFYLIHSSAGERAVGKIAVLR